MLNIKKLSLVLFATFSLGFNSMLYANCKSYITDEWQDSRYTDHSNGTVSDNNTKLIWKKCSQGQTWSSGANTCTGSTTSMNWKEALEEAQSEYFASYKDWRVPNIKELNSLVSLRCYTPSINASVFPNTPSSSFWSSSPFSGTSSYSWYVSFGYGYDYYNSRGSKNAVRLVRGGE